MPNEIVQYQDPVTFRDRVLPTLLEREAENCRLISLASRLAETGTPASAKLWTVESVNGVELVAMQKPDDLVEISRGSTDAAIDLAKALARDGQPAAIAGPLPTVEVVTSHYAKVGRLHRALHRGFRAHAVIEVIAPPRISGTMRVSKPADQSLLAEFIDAYMASIHEPPCADSKALAEQLIADRRMYFWCDPQPVAMAAWAGPTPDGVRINFVFTPEKFQKRGYASNLVAALTQRLLDDGRRSVFLFTDTANAKAERVYQRIGYRAVSDGAHWLFST